MQPFVVCSCVDVKSRIVLEGNQRSFQQRRNETHLSCYEVWIQMAQQSLKARFLTSHYWDTSERTIWYETVTKIAEFVTRRSGRGDSIVTRHKNSSVEDTYWQAIDSCQDLDWQN